MTLVGESSHEKMKLKCSVKWQFGLVPKQCCSDAFLTQAFSPTKLKLLPNDQEAIKNVDEDLLREAVQFCNGFDYNQPLVHEAYGNL